MRRHRSGGHAPGAEAWSEHRPAAGEAVKRCALVSALTLLATASPAQEGDYPPSEGQTSWEPLLEEYWEELPGHDKGSCAITDAAQPRQSPLDLSGWIAAADLPDIEIDYDGPGSTFRVTADRGAHTIQFNLGADSTRAISMGGTDYRLIQFHFHHPSEHLIEGRRKAMELHLVHAADDGSRAVIGVMLKEDPVLDAAGEPVPEAPNRLLWDVMATFTDLMPPVVSVTAEYEGDDLDQLLPASPRPYVTYTGSLTTPGCDGDVTWIVLSTPVGVPPQHVDAFEAMFPTNARPLQDLRGRELKAGTLD